MDEQKITGVVVGQFSEMGFAKMAVELLENEGIMAEISGHGDTALRYYIGDAVTTAKYEVIVHPDFSERAAELIDSMHDYFKVGTEGQPEIADSSWKQLIRVDSSMVAEMIEEQLRDVGIPAKIVEAEDPDEEFYSFDVMVPETRLDDAKALLSEMEEGRRNED